MSERSKRRDAEMAVIDAAVAMIAKGVLVVHYRQEGNRVEIERDAYQVLNRAVGVYCELGLAELAKPKAGLRSPDTSQHSKEWAQQFALSDAGKVFREIYFTWRRRRRFDATRALIAQYQADDGLTSDEIEETLGRTHQSISARVNELKNAGWIVDSGERRKTRSGGKAIVWTPSTQSREWVDQHGLPIPVNVP